MASWYFGSKAGLATSGRQETNERLPHGARAHERAFGRAGQKPGVHESAEELVTHWEPYALAIAGVLGFVLQQISLGTGKLAPSVATVSVANPVVSILLGIFLLDERLSRPAWHIAVAVVGLGVALVGAVLIALARHEGEEEERPVPSVATA